MLAHAVAADKDGGVSIVRCSPDSLDHEINKLMHYITVAEGNEHPLPKHREIWIIGFDDYLSGMSMDELEWFYDKDPTHHHVYKRVRAKGMIKPIRDHRLISGCTRRIMRMISNCQYPTYLDYRDDLIRLYNMLQPEDFESLLLHLAKYSVEDTVDPSDDYIVGMFLRGKCRGIDLTT